MEQFHDGYYVWLRSREHGTYLHADGDGQGVSLRLRRASMNAAWAVHRIHGDDQHVLLRSAAYGRYLAAAYAKAPRGCRGFRVRQRNYDFLDEEVIMWQAVRSRPGNDVLLRHSVGDRARHHYRYLRANGRYLPWRENVVSVHDFDDFDNISTMMHWVVEPIPSRQNVPRLPRPNMFHDIAGSLTAILPPRTVQFMGNSEGVYRHSVAFVFRGWSVFRLRNEVASRLHINRDVSDNLVMYVRAGRYGRYTPLVVDLPRSKQTLVITFEPPANVEARCPDVNAA
ncbi:unnamed protein product [Alopecurus aequalis]